ncbi:MAG: hypothetical protein AAF399_28830, partial [Bacteroidota bacterium]
FSLLRTICISALFVLSFGKGAVAQVTDQIEVSASFSTFMELEIYEATVNWSIQTVEDYTTGFWPIERPIPFSVASSTNFRIDYRNTPMVNEQGVEIDIQNMAYRLEPANNDVKAEYGIRYQWPVGDGGRKGKDKLSGIFVASFTDRTILLPGPAGNAGSFEKNAWKIRIGFASPNIRAITGLPILLDQNIAPGTYTTILTLTAYAEP